MEAAGSFRMNVREYLEKLSDGLFLNFWQPSADEYILWRRPSTCPMIYLWHDQDELLRLIELAEDDPAKQAFIEKRNQTMYLWSFADWNLRYPSRDGGKTPGPPIPVPTIDDETPFTLMGEELRGMLLIIWNHLWFGIDPLVAAEAEDEPQGGESGNPASDTQEEESAAPATLRARPGDDPKPSKRSRKDSGTSLARAS